MNCSAARPSTSAYTASTSLEICARYGAKSWTETGTQIFCAIVPPSATNVRSKPPTDSQPNA